MKFWNRYNKFHKYTVCLFILSAVLVTSSCGSQGKAPQSDPHQGSGADTTDMAQQPGTAQNDRYGSVRASYGVVMPGSRPSV